MRPAIIILLLYCSAAAVFAQSIPGSATIPFQLDHNRILVEVIITSTNGTKKKVRAWVDNGNPGFTITEKLAHSLGITTGEKFRDDSTVFGSGHWLYLGKMIIDLSKVPISEIAPNMASVGVEMNIPASVLRNFEVTVDYPKRKLIITGQGQTTFQGEKVGAIVNAKNGLIQIPVQLDGSS